MTGGLRGWRAGLASLAALLLAALLLAAPAPAAAATTITVTTTQDLNSSNCTTLDTRCSLRDALTSAPSGDTVSVPAGRYQLTQPSAGPLVIANSISVVGAGARTTIIRQTVAGQNVLNIGSEATVSIQGVTITGGSAIDGGGLVNGGTLTLSESAVTGNAADGISTNGGSTNLPGAGGGVDNIGLLTVIRSTISGNAAKQGQGTGPASGALGGGVYGDGLVKLINSTIAGNSAQGNTSSGQGGGIYMTGASAAELVLANTTVALNSATGTPAQGGNIYIDVTGGPIVTAVKNSIIAGGTADSGTENCTGETLTSDGFNLEDRNQCGFTSTGDHHSVAAKLDVLEKNGGPTNTLALLPGSPAINGGNPAGCTGPSGGVLATDQRAIFRPQGWVCDIGAFEFRVPSLSGSASVFGDPRVGQELNCVLPVIRTPDGPATFSVVWLRGGSPVGSNDAYVVRRADRGHTLACRVRAKNAAGSASATSRSVRVT